MARKLRAYAVFGGGGMRGAALAGALKAAQDLDIEFIGYAGVSAGSIIALLAAAGYTGEDLVDILTKDTGFAQLLDDHGDDLYAMGQAFEELKIFIESEEFQKFQRARRQKGMRASVRTMWTAWSLYRSHEKFIDRVEKLINPILFGFGLYTGDPAIGYLKKLIIDKVPRLKGADDISFKALREAVHSDPDEQVKLKILATDLVSGREVRFPNENLPDAQALNASVLDAVRASIGYPLVFQPKELGHQYLVDGGVSSGLPVFLFEREFQQTKIPVIAFELGDNARGRNATSYTFFDYASDLLDATINASDATERITTEGIYPVHLRIRRELALHFRASQQTLERMAKDGYDQARDRLIEIKNLEPWAEQRRDRLAGHVRLLLNSLVHEIEGKTALKHCRAYVMLRTVNGKRKVRYYKRMRHDPDRNMTIGMTEGPSGNVLTIDPDGRVRAARKVGFTDLDTFREMGLPGAELPPPSQIGIITAPLLQYWGTDGVVAGSQLNVLGTLSVDFTADPREDNSAVDVAADEADEKANTIVEQWADIISVQLRYESLSDGGS